MSAFRDGSESIYRHQQNNTDDIEIGGPAFINAWRNLRHHHHDDQTHRDLADFTLHHANILTAGAPDNQGAVNQQCQ
ncbi:Uncharacterised protein [Shigella flexneri]|nr:Uncharacterised protein [Shigella flexneri]